jgi:hypothetical protein
MHKIAGKCRYAEKTADITTKRYIRMYKNGKTYLHNMIRGCIIMHENVEKIFLKHFTIVKSCTNIIGNAALQGGRKAEHILTMCGQRFDNRKDGRKAG